MTPTLRSTTLAAALAAASFGAIAEKIDFESFWSGKIEPTAPPIALGATSVPGFVFSTGSAWAYKKEILKPMADILPDFWDNFDNTNSASDCKGTEPECNRTGFIMNRSRGEGVAGNVIDISLDPSVFGSRFITSISLELFHNSDRGKVTAINAKGETADLQGFSIGNRRWSSWTADLMRSNIQDITTLRFDFGRSALALDNLDFSLSGTTPGGGGTVPEPASYALVGLALLGAAASRRRKA